MATRVRHPPERGWILPTSGRNPRGTTKIGNITIFPIYRIARELLHKPEWRVADLIDDQPLRREGVDIMDWRHIAACREVDPELFFPIGNSGPALLQIEEAKQVCRRCTVLDECLRWAIDSGQDAGVWGGMSEDERRALKRRTLRLRARAGV
jgi:WhiB family transcriptional regulator, redox-sensing transcriptional regulator